MKRFAISLALVVILVSSCQSEMTNSKIPPTSNRTTANTYEATSNNLQITYRLTGNSTYSKYVGSQIPSNTKIKLHVREGTFVKKGQTLGKFTPESRLLSIYKIQAKTGTIAASKYETLRERQGIVRAQASGILRIYKNSVFIESDGLDAVTSLTPLQALRFSGFNFLGSVEIETLFGTESPSCDAVWVEKTIESSESVLHCRIPQEIETVAGLQLTITLKSMLMKDVIAVPAVYVSLSEDGSSYLVTIKKNDETVSRKVTVGPTDGVKRVITSGIAVGEMLVIPNSGE